ncbi:MAG: hypothetical protein COA42_21390 [Alteromonadaceae bacterium]|nr:MAG: hypothetical protein COA42_21390 [Alteromonadaceae bacterium]
MMLQRISAFLCEPGKLDKDTLFERFLQQYASDKQVESEVKELPFNRGALLKISIKGYWISLNYLTDGIDEHLAKVESVVGALAPQPLKPYCELRALFAPDERADFYAYTAKTLEFLQGLPNAVIYDTENEQVIALTV